MSIESKMEKLAASIDNLATMIATLRENKVELPPQTITVPNETTTPPPGPPTTPKVDQLTPEEVNAELIAVAQKMGDAGAGIHKLLTEEFKANSLKDVDPSRYSELVLKAQGMTNA